ncbi:hypothetical protein [Bradyrhizobium sp. LMTR 3]|uniref:hypothetical protein n=1 Tax=Bradyrhizobium sp. LMTR 3 TaxID=189873 RepID=UPI000810D533|nr:hypothetical protein [Bradyrhizobium sp. LMTR 3]OCK56771.1 hypothetical protein LMTR3_14145 [Bradyrhizobium sp. LMTR 3]
MPAGISDVVADNGLSVLDTLTSHIFICSSEPANYAQASTTYVLGVKSWGAGNVFSSPSDASPNGRKVSSVAITDGTITTSGTASWWAACGTASLHAHGPLAAAQVVAVTNTFTLASFDIRLPAE